jgi:hypothetical protein
MERKFRQTIYIFKLFNPAKRFSSFDFIELTWEEISLLNCRKNEIVKIWGKFYIFSHIVENDLNQKSNSLIIFKHRQKDFKIIKV